MKRITAVFTFMIAMAMFGHAQDISTTQQADTTQYTIVYYNIFDELNRPGFDNAKAVISQPISVKKSLYSHISRNEKNSTLDGYRIRVYSDNSQRSRQHSEYLANELSNKYVNHRAYRSYASPYFRVSIGDFRTLNEARAFLEEIKIEYPKAYPVKEKINLPPL